VRENLWFGLAAAALLAAMGAAQIASALQETQTWDEGIHVAAGYSYLKTGDYHLNREHPPLFKLLCALPLLGLDVELPPVFATSKEPLGAEFGDLFLYRNRVPADSILLCARLVTVAVTLALGLAVAWWTRRRFGRAAALAALALFAFDPNLIAHGHYVTNDVWAAAGVFLATIAWARWLETKRWRDLAIAGVAIGFALATKFSVAFLPLPLALLYWFRRWQEGRGRLSLRHFAASAAVAGLLASGVVALVYGPETVRCFQPRPGIGRSPRLSLPKHPYLIGLAEVARHNKAGHPAYLMGVQSRMGWWCYFPVVFAIKTPAATLALLAVALAVGLAALARRRSWDPRRIPFEWVVLTAPPLTYFGLSMASHINLGVRHLLPIYPFLFIAVAAAAVKTRWSRRVLPVLLVVAAIESAAVYPHYLAFFNVFIGGPGNGPKYLVDSNIDWGQDLKNLRRYLDRRGAPKLCISYFGRADLSTYGITQFESVPTTWQTAERRNADCLAAVSATLLYGVYVGEDTYRWLREREPAAKVGYSIYVYDLRRGKAR